MRIAKEGYPYIAILTLLGVAALVFGWLWVGIAILGLACFVTYFFRDPERIFQGTEREQKAAPNQRQP